MSEEAGKPISERRWFQFTIGPAFIIFLALIGTGMVRQEQIWFVFASLLAIPMAIFVFRSNLQAAKDGKIPRDSFGPTAKTSVLRVLALSACSFGGFAVYGFVWALPMRNVAFATTAACVSLSTFVLVVSLWKHDPPNCDDPPP